MFAIITESQTHCHRCIDSTQKCGTMTGDQAQCNSNMHKAESYQNVNPPIASGQHTNLLIYFLLLAYKCFELQY